jgi:GTP-binding protein
MTQNPATAEEKDANDFATWLWQGGDSRFCFGVANIAQLPAPTAPEIAFLGRSNVGKSSLLNALLGRSALAYISKTPGATRQLNFFSVRNDSCVMVDVPGYGYAKVSAHETKRWENLILDYVRGRPNLVRACVLIDARRGIQEKDRAIMKQLDQAAVSYQIILTKSDAVKSSALQSAREDIISLAPEHTALFPEVISTSSRTAEGIENLRRQLGLLLYAVGTRMRR